MPYRITIGGLTIEADTAEEALALSAKAGEVAAKQPQPTPQPAQPEPPRIPVVSPPVLGPRSWEPRDVTELMHHPKLVDTVKTVIKLGSGVTTTAFSEDLDVRPNGSGVRVRYVARMAKELDPRLPPPLILTGEAGEKSIELDPSFEAAYQEAFPG